MDVQRLGPRAPHYGAELNRRLMPRALTASLGTLVLAANGQLPPPISRNRRWRRVLFRSPHLEALRPMDDDKYASVDFVITSLYDSP